MFSTNLELNIITNILALHMKNVQYPEIKYLPQVPGLECQLQVPPSYPSCTSSLEGSWSGLVPRARLVLGPSCPHQLLKSVVWVNCLHLQCFHSTGPLFCKPSLWVAGEPLNAMCNLWGPGPSWGWPFKRLSPPVMEHFSCTISDLQSSTLRASPEGRTP